MHTELGKSYNSFPSFYKHKPTFSTMFWNIMTTVISSQTADGLPAVPLLAQSTGHGTEPWDIKTLKPCVAFSPLVTQLEVWQKATASF